MSAILPFVIRSRLGSGPSIVRKASAGLLMARRTVIQFFSNASGDKRILFIFGCQRSGTTMLSQIFEGDATVSPFAEHSRDLARADHPLRIRDLESVEDVFSQCRGRLIVAKPLVESQRADEILTHFERARAVWMYRDFRDVVRSYVKAFDRAGVNIMRKIIDRVDNWASERVPDATRAVIAEFYSDDISVYDAAALYWWIRNGLFFELGLNRHPRVMPCRYEDLVSHPDAIMRSIYAFAAVDYPGPHLVDGVHRESKGLGRSVDLSPKVESLCSERLAELDVAMESFKRHYP